MSLYEKFALKEQYIRLVRFEATNAREAPLIAELFIASLDTNPQYVALSYRWGHLVSTRQIRCNGELLSITEELESALTSFRSTIPSLPLWVDQLCINQANLSERSSQVSLMHKIFSQALQTYVYLGEPQSDVMHTACEVVERIKTPINASWALGGDYDTSKLDYRHYFTKCKVIAQHPYLAKRGLQKDVSRAFQDMVHNLIFTRKWIIQEIALSRSLCCLFGQYQLEWKALFAASMQEAAAPGQTPRHVYHIQWLFHLNKSFCYDWEQPSLLTLLYYSRTFKAADPHDHIYALLGAASDAAEFPTPNYGTDIGVLYHDVSKCLIRKGKGFSLLHLTGIKPIDNGLPSWVVDWGDLDSFYSCKFFLSFTAGGEHGSIKLGADETTICALGRCIDYVRACGECFDSEANLLDRLEQYVHNCANVFKNDYDQRTELAIQQDLASLISFDMELEINAENDLWYQFDDKNFDMASGEDLIPVEQATRRQTLLIMMAFQLTYMEKSLSRISDRVSRGDLWRAFQKLRPEETARRLVVKELIRGMLTSCWEANFRRWNFFRQSTRPIMTQKQRLGLAPTLTEEKDVVCVVQGAKAPCILRPCGYGTYRLVGEAYIQGVMFGEALDDDDGCPWEEIIIR